MSVTRSMNGRGAFAGAPQPVPRTTQWHGWHLIATDSWRLGSVRPMDVKRLGDQPIYRAAGIGHMPEHFDTYRAACDYLEGPTNREPVDGAVWNKELYG